MFRAGLQRRPACTSEEPKSIFSQPSPTVSVSHASEVAKLNAGVEAAKLVRNGMLLGLGTGSTVSYALRELAERIKHDGLKVQGVATSVQTEGLAKELGIPLTSLEKHPRLDLDIDGADEVDPDLNLIKGGGGAHVREKIVAKASELVAIVVDESKLSRRLGEKSAVPVEVLPFALPLVTREMSSLGGRCKLRMVKGLNEAFRTDNGNLILDCDFGPIPEPDALEADIRSIPGVLESGIFHHVANLVIVGSSVGTRVIRRG